MQGNGYNNYQYPIYQAPVQAPACPAPNLGANAVNINIVSPQAYATNPNVSKGFYPMYGPNTNPVLPLYPQNYNNMIQKTPTSALNAVSDNNLLNKTSQKQTSTKESSIEEDKNDKKTQKTKEITPLTDDYVKSLENYLNNDNPKVRLIGAKELMERFKEDENRADNPSLIPLLNKSLKDPNAAVRFLALTTLQLGYSVGNDETVQILKNIQTNAVDKFAEDSLLASEILLKLAGSEKFEIPDNSPEPAKPKDQEQNNESSSS